MISFAPQIAQIFTDYFISSLPSLVIQTTKGRKDLKSDSVCIQILRYALNDNKRGNSPLERGWGCVMSDAKNAQLDAL